MNSCDGHSRVKFAAGGQKRSKKSSRQLASSSRDDAACLELKHSEGIKNVLSDVRRIRLT